MAVNARVLRLLEGVRRWREPNKTEPIDVSPELSDSDRRKVRRLVDEIVETKGGEVAARRRARLLALTYARLVSEGRRRFFEMLALDYGHDDRAVDDAIDHVLHAADATERRSAEWQLRDALRSQRELLLRRFVGLDGGLPFLVKMREDLLEVPWTEGGSPPLAWADLDRDLCRILERWFDVALLQLEQLTWGTPAVLLEKLIEYEAVHAIHSWGDLKGRLGRGRRCYAFLHPAMPDDPLIFVEVALTSGMADSVGPLLRPGDGEPRLGGQGEADEQEHRYDTAIFYSISNCHRGLAGVSLGDFLIKSVVEELSNELPNLKLFATLSPLPGFRSWLQEQLERELAASVEQPTEWNNDSSLLAPSERTAIAAARNDGREAAHATRLLTELVHGPLPNADDPVLAAAQPALLRLAAHYLLNETRPSRRNPQSSRSEAADSDQLQRALDPVAHFHLSNGARAERLNWMANPTEIGWERSLGLMVNYRYELKWIEPNHDRYVGQGLVNASEAVRRLLLPTGPSSDRSASPRTR